MRTPPPTGPLVIGVLHRIEWLGDAEAIADALARIEAVDPRVEVVVEPYDEGQQLRTLRGRPDRLDEARGLVPALTDAQRAMFDRVHAVITLDLPFDVATIAPRLSWVQGVGAGYAQLESAGLFDAGIRLTNAAGTSAVAIAEFVVGRILEERKHFRVIDEHQRSRRWVPVHGSELQGATVGLIGYGAIGQAVARLLRAFGVTVLATRRSGPGADDAGAVSEVFGPEGLEEMLGRCDTVVAAVPESPETIGLMDATAFAAMPRGSFFVNVGRGTLVDEPALVDALRDGQLRGAALDVMSQEPMPEDHALWDAPNLVLSAHCATATDTLFPNLYRLWADNLVRWIAGRPLVNEVGPAR